MAEGKCFIVFYFSGAFDCENFFNCNFFWFVKRGLRIEVSVVGNVICFLKENNKLKWLFLLYLKGKIIGLFWGFFLFLDKIGK